MDGTSGKMTVTKPNRTRAENPSGKNSERTRRRQSERMAGKGAGAGLFRRLSTAIVPRHHSRPLSSHRLPNHCRLFHRAPAPSGLEPPFSAHHKFNPTTSITRPSAGWDRAVIYCASEKVPAVFPERDDRPKEIVDRYQDMSIKGDLDATNKASTRDSRTCQSDPRRHSHLAPHHPSLS